LEQQIVQIASDPTGFVEVAEAGPRFVRRFHDGAYAARVLGRWLGVTDDEELAALERDDLCRI
jgi:hypothetical protein